MKPGSLLIRADANPAIGTGHVMRCLALAQAWQDRGGTTTLATAELPDALAPRLLAENLALQRIEATPGSLGDARETMDLARRTRAGWIVVDGDRFDSKFLEKIRAAGCPVAVIDDFAGRDSYSVDLVVNPNLDEDVQRYRKRGADAQICMGQSFLLLRREFQQASMDRKIARVEHRILVTLGGSDPDHLTTRVVEALAQAPGMEVTAVAGAGFDKLAELEALRADHVRIFSNPGNMPALMKQSEMAVIAAGGTLWELLSMGCAVLSYSRNIVQERVIQTLSQRGIVMNLGETRNFDAAQLVARVLELSASREDRERKTALGRGLVDGLGANRVVEAMLHSGVNSW